MPVRVAGAHALPCSTHAAHTTHRAPSRTVSHIQLDLRPETGRAGDVQVGAGSRSTALAAPISSVKYKEQQASGQAGLATGSGMAAASSMTSSSACASWALWCGWMYCTVCMHTPSSASEHTSVAEWLDLCSCMQYAPCSSENQPSCTWAQQVHERPTAELNRKSLCHCASRWQPGHRMPLAGMLVGEHAHNCHVQGQDGAAVVCRQHSKGWINAHRTQDTGQAPGGGACRC